MCTCTYLYSQMISRVCGRQFTQRCTLHTLGVCDAHSPPMDQAILPATVLSRRHGSSSIMSRLLKSMRSQQRNPKSLLMCEVIHMPFQTPPGLIASAKHTQEKRQKLHPRQKPGKQVFPTATRWCQSLTSPGACVTWTEFAR